MENKKRKRHAVKPGLILVAIWIMAASLVFSVSADTTGNGSSNGIDWKWTALKTTTNTEGGSGSAEVTVTVEESGDTAIYTLNYKIGATSAAQTSSTDTCDNTTYNEDASPVTVTATVINNTGFPLAVSTISTSNNLATVENASTGTIISTGGSFEIKLNASIPDDANDKESTSTNSTTDVVTITLSKVDNLKVTYYGAANASYTYNSVTLDSTLTSTIIEVDPNGTITLPEVPTVTSGTFAGWRISQDGSLLAAGATVTIENDTSVYPVIVPDGAVKPFTVKDGSDYYFWTDAAKAAGSSGTIILNQDYTLPTTMSANGVSPAGSPYVTGSDGNVSYSIPSGVTLLIPFDPTYTLCTTEPAYAGENMTTPTAYLTLTMASGTKLVVSGAMSVSGKHTFTNAGGQSGSPTGPLGFVEMEEGSNITVNDGGILYAWGYIIGDGTVTAKNGATVYEILQMPEYRGGSQTSSMKNNVYPISQFYVQNIEVPLTLEYGATERVYGTLCITVSTIYTGYEPVDAILIGASNSMFLVKSGSVTKSYDSDSDRLILEINGDVAISPIKLAMGSSGFTQQEIDSSKFVLPINGGFTIYVKSGHALTVSSGQRVLLQPGAQVIIEEKATVTVNSALYVYDADQWGNFTYYGVSGGTNSYDTPVIPVMYSPTRTTPRATLAKGGDVASFIQTMPDVSIQVDGTLTGNIYTTAGGANIFSTGTGTFTQTATANASVYQFTQNTTTYTEHSSSPATLQNGGDRGVVNSTAGTYNYKNGYWHLSPCDGSTRETTTATCTEAGTKTTACTCGVVNTTSDDPAKGHTFENGICKVCSCYLFEFTAANVVLGNNLDMLFAFTYNGTDTLTADSGYYVELKRSVADGTTKTVTFTFDNWTTNNGFYVVKYGDLAAKEMCDEIKLTIYDGNHNQVSNTWTDSMQKYAMRQIEKYEKQEASTEKNLILAALVDMLNYGAEAQKRFNYDAVNLANGKLTDTQKGYDTDAVTKTAAESTVATPWVASNLVTTSNIQFLMAFSDIQDGATVTITYKDHYNEDQTVNITTFAENNGVKYITIDTLVVADAWQVMTVVLKNGDAEYRFTESIAGYLERYTDHGDLNAAFLKFAQSAYNYFEYKKSPETT